MNNIQTLESVTQGQKNKPMEEPREMFNLTVELDAIDYSALRLLSKFADLPPEDWLREMIRDLAVHYVYGTRLAEAYMERVKDKIVEKECAAKA